MRQSGYTKIEDQVTHLKTFVETRTRCSKNNISDLHKKISFFVADFKQRWHGANRKEDRFLVKNKDWLDSSINFPADVTVSRTVVGRPSISFEQASERTKRQKTMPLRALHSSEELSFAAQMSLRSTGQVDASKVVKEVTSTSPSRAIKYLTAYKKSNITTKGQLMGTEALAMCVEAKLTRHQYNIIRENDKFRFPSYKIIQSAKKECYPQKEHIRVTDTVAEVKLQALLDHTASRILEAQKEVLHSRPSKDLKHLVLICKWGFDGSTQSEYKQKFTDNPTASDANIFMTSLVPLRLLSGKSDEEQQIVLWQNERTSSTRYCRPIRFQFEHETSELSKKERLTIQTQIDQLQAMIYILNDTTIQIQYKMLFTMVDGKVCNAVTETTSTKRCFICGLTSKDFNNIEKVCKTDIIGTDRLEFGLSVLHAQIRFFECLLHLAYKLPVKKWQIRGEEDKEIVAHRKKYIQGRFRLEMGLSVDKPKPGFGSSNDGNTSRRFFSDPEVSANITGVDSIIIKKFKVVLQAISSGYEVDAEKFRTYALGTAKLFVEKYAWYPMPPTVHKVLIHGPEIIEFALLPIGQLSEEAQEARNKEFKKFRENFSRKTSRIKTNEDILNILLISSDPLITSMRKVPKRKNSSFEKEVLDLLIPPVVYVSTDVSIASTLSDTTCNSSSESE